jgi:putative Holliday junction resolvase
MFLTIEDLKILKKEKKNLCRLMGIDWGSKRIGISISDPLWLMASPLAVIQSKKESIDLIVDIAKKQSVCSIVIGFPYKENFLENTDVCTKIKKFSKILFDKSQLPQIFRDEYGTSFEAKNIKKQHSFESKSHKKRSPHEKIESCDYIDDIASAIILSDILNLI